MNQPEAISLLQQSEELPPQLRRLVSLEVCSKWPKVFPISNYCAYKEDIKQKQASFLENAVDNVIRGNEVINYSYIILSVFTIQRVKYT